MRTCMTDIGLLKSVITWQDLYIMFIEANLSEPHMLGHPRKFCVVDHTQTVTENIEKLTIVDHATMK